MLSARIIGSTPIFASLYRSYSTGTDGASDTTHTQQACSAARCATALHTSAAFVTEGETMRQRFITLLATTALFTAVASHALAQENLPNGPENYEQDYQIFAPYSLDLNNMVDKQISGYFFNYDKLYQSYSGERVTIGSSNVSETITFFNGVQNQVITATDGEFAEIIYRVNPQDFVNQNNPLPAPYVVHNTLNNVPPRAGFAFGNRYELGYRDEGHGWTVGVLDGPELNQTQSFGFIKQDTNGDGVPDGLPPFKDTDYTNGTDIAATGSVFQQSTGPNAGGNERSFGFGSVPVIFETAPGYLVGFRDYMNNFSDALLGTQSGIMAYVGNYGRSVDPNTLPIPFLHIADDINGNGILGAFPIIIVGPDGVPRLGFLHDFDDLHKFDIFFDNVTVHNRTQTGGVELMWNHALTKQNYMAKNQNNEITASWGARFFRMYDEFDVNGTGSILGNSFWDTSFTNNIVGPQVAMRWVNERQRWRIQADARFMAGFNIANWDQIGLIGEELIPGALNRPIYARPTAFSHGLRELEFAPVGELRVATSYHITNAFAVNVGYTGSVVGGIRRAAPSVHYSLPEMGFVDAGTQQLLVNGVDFGVEFVH